ncbi:PTS IIA-like nitrogen regulatory protein PtsN [Atopomonas sediminilitoris]|uniref:PTS IIA-like nitrogen regulatory protein PtsN n=1 Tax=Atopomonas sediminilitoris TaxID=2919919 RepID=UPI001F4DCB2F|nr:PTS IIA-like nitrogen regulatory protein PtsN [Atopomonas sediminilitoris]MCJ8169968.1 PTS IIA-like nitrogen regulatory protein PtsN [Atopomonas sediminilitoris]
MIRLQQILTPERSLVNVQGGSKKRVLEHIAELVAKDQPGLSADTIFDSLIARERLGSTGFGNGIAIPHCRIAGASEPMSMVLHLSDAIDFDALDGAPVDLLFVLLVPEEATDEHLELLSQVAGLLDKPAIRQQLRDADSNQALYQTIVDLQQAA